MTGSKMAPTSVHVIVIAGKLEQRLNIPQTDKIERKVQGVYRIFGSPQKYRPYFQDIPHIALKRTKEIPSIKITKTEDLLKRTYTLVVYNFRNPTAQQKKRTQRLIRRSPCIRIRPGVLLFPHLKSKEMIRIYKSKNKAQLYTAQEFASKMVEFGANVARWGKLKLSGPRSQSLVERILEDMIKTETDMLIDKFKKLKKDIDNPLITPKRLKARYQSLSTRYNQRKATCEIIRAVWKYSCEKQLRKVYNIMLLTRRAISEHRQGMREMVEIREIDESTTADHQSS
ncbi:MAG: hypothetical protein GF411_16020 [Candidatus Lokiarchaeota archaeon]|nr:hypothetical protein [Candidatus Lokiarchaeota archaeon]